MHILIPNSAIQNVFSEVATPIDAASIQNLRESNVLSSIRDSLLPKLLSGQIPDAEQQLAKVI